MREDLGTCIVKNLGGCKVELLVLYRLNGVQILFSF